MPVSPRFHSPRVLALLFACCTILSGPAAPVLAEMPRLQPGAPREVQKVELDRARAQFDMVTRRAEAVRRDLARIDRQMKDIRMLALQGRDAEVRSGLAQVATRVEALQRDTATLLRLTKTPDQMRAIELADLLRPGQAARWSDLVGKLSLERDTAALSDALQGGKAEYVRNERQEFPTAFENFDQKANQLYNILSTVLKAMMEMRSAIVRNLQ